MAGAGAGAGGWCGGDARVRAAAGGGGVGGGAERGSGTGAAGAVGAHDGQHGADVDGLALLDADLGQRPRRGRRHFGVDLVGRDLEERLVARDGLAHRLQPLRDRALGDGLAELGHRDVSQRATPFR